MTTHSVIVLSAILLTTVCMYVTGGKILICPPAPHQKYVSCGDKKCLCSETTALCQQHYKNLKYIPRLPTGLTQLNFRSNYLPNVNKETFVNVSVFSIEVLSLFKNEIKTVSQDAFSGFTKLLILCLDLNVEINTLELSKSFSDIRTTNPLELHLSNIGLANLTDNYFTPLAHVEKLDLSRNQIDLLNTVAFRNLDNLTDLLLTANRIREITPAIGIEGLIYLNLGGNEMGSESLRFCSSKDGAPLFPNLQKLYLGENLIREVSTSSFNCLSKLRTLNLGRNLISVIGNNVFSNLNQLKKLHLKKMKGGISRIQPNALDISGLEELSLEENHYVFHPQDVNMFNQTTNLRKLILSFNTLNKLLNEHLTTLLGPLKRLEKLIAVRVKISSLPTDFLDNLKNLTYVSLEGNSISMLPRVSSPVHKYNFFSLQGNEIRVLEQNSTSRRFLSSVETLSIADNPFTCTCENMWFRSIIKENGKLDNTTLVHWPQRFHCASPKQLKDTLFRDYHPTDSSCNNNNYFVIITVPVAAILVISLVTTIIVYKYKWYVKYWLYKLKSKKQSPEHRPLLESRYDAFVVYNTNDSHFVHQDFQLLLEEAHAYKLHLWERDVTSGHNNFREMVAAIETSQSAIAVISKDSLDDGWFQFQLSVALDRQVELKRPYLMLVILENVDCERLSKFWCVLLTRLPTARWCPDTTSVKRAVFEQQLCSYLGNKHGHQ